MKKKIRKLFKEFCERHGDNTITLVFFPKGNEGYVQDTNDEEMFLFDSTKELIERLGYNYKISNGPLYKKYCEI